MSCYITYNNKNYTEKDFKEYLKNILDQSKAASLVKEIQPKQENIATPIVNKETTVLTPEMIRARVKSSFDANGYMDIKETSRGDKVILGAITKYIMATKGIITNNQILEANKTFKLKEEVTIETIKEGVLRIKIKENLLEGDGDVGLFRGLDMSKLTSSGEFMANDIFKVKEGVSEVFKDNESLASIGTEQQYSQYLDTIFPDSKVKDIVYHGSKNKFDKFDKTFSGSNTGNKSDLIYFTKHLSKVTDVTKPYFGNVYRVIVNLKNPRILDWENDGYESSIYRKKGDEDGIILEVSPDTLGVNKENEEEIGVFEPEQIHILSSKKDLEMFRNFIKFTKSEYVQHGDIQQFNEYFKSHFFEFAGDFLGSKQDIEGFKDFVSKNKSLNNIEQAFKCK